jgi:hypothetical protein
MRAVFERPLRPALRNPSRMFALHPDLGSALSVKGHAPEHSSGSGAVCGHLTACIVMLYNNSSSHSISG